MKPLPILLVLALAATQSSAGEIYQDFRDKDVDVKLFRRTGDMAGERIRTEATGLRITLPADPVTKTLGLNTRAPTKGDFEITVGYEILQADRPTKGSGLGLEIYLKTDTPTDEALVFYRIVKADKGEVYMCDKKTTTTKGNRDTKRTYADAARKSGQLRLTRKGKEVAYLVTEGEATEFRELCKYTWDTMDVQGIAVRAWGSQNVVDLRITHIRIRDEIEEASSANVDTMERPQPVAEEVKQASATSSWLLWVVVGLAVVMVLGLGLLVVVLVLVVKGRNHAKATPVPSETISFHCSGCGKSLKTKAGSVGKKVKCPGCGVHTAVRAKATSA